MWLLPSTLRLLEDDCFSPSNSLALQQKGFEGLLLTTRRGLTLVVDILLLGPLAVISRGSLHSEKVVMGMALFTITENLCPRTMWLILSAL